MSTADGGTGNLHPSEGGGKKGGRGDMCQALSGAGEGGREEGLIAYPRDVDHQT